MAKPVQDVCFNLLVMLCLSCEGVFGGCREKWKKTEKMPDFIRAKIHWTVKKYSTCKYILLCQHSEKLYKILLKNFYPVNPV